MGLMHDQIHVSHYFLRSELKFFLNFIWKAKREREISHLLVDCLKACNSQDWVRLQSEESRIPFKVWCHLYGWQGSPRAWTIIYSFQDMHEQKAGWEVWESRIEPGTPLRDVSVPSSRACLSCTSLALMTRFTPTCQAGAPAFVKCVPFVSLLKDL